MVRFMVRTLLSFIANAVGLIVAATLLEGFTIEGVSFVVAVAFFTLATVVLGPLIVKIALTNASYLMGGIALVTTFVGLVITTIFTDGLAINGVSTWFMATFIVWAFSVIANVILPMLLFKKILSDEPKNTTDKN